MMPLGPPGEEDWDPTNIFSGSRAGSPVRQRKDYGKLQAGSDRKHTKLVYSEKRCDSRSGGVSHEAVRC